MAYPPSIQKLIGLFSKFPTVGPKTAARFVFHIIRSRKEETEELVEAISHLKNEIKVCALCFNTFQPSKDDSRVCQTCLDPRRDKSLLCVVEKETDLTAIEKTKDYKGLYFVLGGVISTLRKKEMKKIRVEQLKERVKRTPEIKEVIIATNPTQNGEATALFIERLLSPYNIKVTRLGRGLPVGGELEYADKETLKSALEGRK